MATHDLKLVWDTMIAVKNKQCNPEQPSLEHENTNFALQRFIKPKGLRAFKVRTALSAYSPPRTYLVSNQEAYVEESANAEDPDLTTGAAVNRAGAGGVDGCGNGGDDRTESKGMVAEGGIGVGGVKENPRKQMLQVLNDSGPSEKEKHSFITHASLGPPHMTIHSIGGRGVSETTKMAADVWDFVELNLGMRLQDLVCDFIKDDMGTWYSHKLQVNSHAHTHTGREDH